MCVSVGVFVSCWRQRGVLVVTNNFSDFFIKKRKLGIYPGWKHRFELCLRKKTKSVEYRNYKVT